MSICWSGGRGISAVAGRDCGEARGGGAGAGRDWKLERPTGRNAGGEGGDDSESERARRDWDRKGRGGDCVTGQDSGPRGDSLFSFLFRIGGGTGSDPDERGVGTV